MVMIQTGTWYLYPLQYSREDAAARALQPLRASSVAVCVSVPRRRSAINKRTKQNFEPAKISHILFVARAARASSLSSRENPLHWFGAPKSVLYQQLFPYKFKKFLASTPKVDNHNILIDDNIETMVNSTQQFVPQDASIGSIGALKSGHPTGTRRPFQPRSVNAPSSPSPAKSSKVRDIRDIRVLYNGLFSFEGFASIRVCINFILEPFD